MGCRSRNSNVRAALHALEKTERALRQAGMDKHDATKIAVRVAFASLGFSDAEIEDATNRVLPATQHASADSKHKDQDQPQNKET